MFPEILKVRYENYRLLTRKYVHMLNETKKKEKSALSTTKIVLNIATLG